MLAVQAIRGLEGNLVAAFFANQAPFRGAGTASCWGRPRPWYHASPGGKIGGEEEIAGDQVDQADRPPNTVWYTVDEATHTPQKSTSAGVGASDTNMDKYR